MATINAGNISKGSYIIFKDAPHQVTKAEFMAPGKGSPIMRVRMRNIRSGVITEFTYKTNESVEVADVDKKEMQYLYKDDQEVYFMDPMTYDQISVPVSVMEDQTQFLIPDIKCWITFYLDKPVGVILPPHVNMKVIEAPEAVAGNRVNAPKKLVKLETGHEVLAPLFIKEGEMVIIDTASGEYVSRVT